MKSPAKHLPGKHLTIRGVSPEVDSALRREQRRRGTSLNQTVLDLLRRSLGLSNGAPYSNGLRRFAGTWDQATFEEFEESMKQFEEIDEEDWK